MKRFLCMTIIAFSLASPAASDDAQDGTSLMEEGAKLFFRGLQQQAEPAMKELRALIQNMGPAMQEFVQEMGPALNELMLQIDDLSNYEAPEMLPNGDIIMRRKPDIPKSTPEEDEIEI